MKAMHSAPPEKAWRLGKGPFIFSGIPPVCNGMVELINLSDEKVKVRSLPALSKKGTAPSGFLDEAQVGVTLAPQSRVRVAACFDIDPHTPGGTYNTTLSCGKQKEEVVVHVFNDPGLELDPERIFLRGAAGEKLSHMLVIRNTGNVVFSLPDVSLIWLEEQDWVGRTLVYTLRESSKSDNHEDFLNRTLREFQSEMIPSTRVMLETKSSTIHPGEVAEVQLTLTLPEELKKGRTYFGFIKMPGRRLWFEIECNGVPKSAKRRQK